MASRGKVKSQQSKRYRMGGVSSTELARKRRNRTRSFATTDWRLDRDGRTVGKWEDR